MAYFWSHCRCPSCFLGWAHATCVWAPASFPLIHSSGRSTSYQPTLLRLPPTPALNRFTLPPEQNPQLLNTVSKTLRGLALVHSSNLTFSSTPQQPFAAMRRGPYQLPSTPYMFLSPYVWSCSLRRECFYPLNSYSVQLQTSSMNLSLFSPVDSGSSCPLPSHPIQFLQWFSYHILPFCS